MLVAFPVNKHTFEQQIVNLYLQQEGLVILLLYIINLQAPTYFYSWASGVQHSKSH